MDEENEIKEAKSKIDKEIEEMEDRLAEEQDNLSFEIDFFGEGREIDERRKTIAEIEKNLADWEKLEIIARKRFAETIKKKQQEEAEKRELAKARFSAIVSKARFLHYTTDALRKRFKEQEWTKTKQYNILNGVLSELLKNSNTNSREQLKIILERWQKRISFVDKQYEAGHNTPSKFIPRGEKQEELNNQIKAHPEPLLHYLYKTGQIELADEDIQTINEWVKTRRIEDPSCDIQEIK